MRKTLIAAVIAAIVGAVLLLPGVAFAEPPPTPAGSFVNAGGVPAGSTLVLNIAYKVTNDEDSGNVGYWALDNYNKSVQVWQTPDDTFYAVVRYGGSWQTFAGALSPGDGTLECADGSGTFQGGYIATFSGTFTPGSQKTHGSIGSFDFGGTKADILLGTYGAGAGQTGSSPTFDWLSTYFTSTANFTQPAWGWTYHYRSQAWNNFSSGTTGDIIIP